VTQTLYGIASKLYRACKPVRDRQYRQYIKTLPCCACGNSCWVDPAHTGPHGHGSKASDLLCIPLCRVCHDAYDRSPESFSVRRGMDVEALVCMFRAMYLLKFPDRSFEGEDAA
jgi:hypothetical protein